MKLTRDDITTIAKAHGLDYARLMAFITVESGGTGFDPKTGKIIIQFEPTWFSRYLTRFGVPHQMVRTTGADGAREYRITVGNKVLQNGVRGQASEWAAFNIAFSIHPTAAMLSTSIGLMQIMGFHYARLGYDHVGAMWDDFKKGEYQQVSGGVKFIATDSTLFKALIRKDWATVARLYNGAGYAVNQYDVKMAKAYLHYSIS